VIPEAVRRASPGEAEMTDWACRSALERLGIATSGVIARFFGLASIDEAKAWCGRQRGKGAVPVSVQLLTSLPESPPRLRALNPFDPLLRDRARLARLFPFDYRIEVFVPVARRTYGYYVFPLLEGEALVGRLDMKANRAAGALEVNAL
jgi:uncharacterized protein YcaQ